MDRVQIQSPPPMSAPSVHNNNDGIGGSRFREQFFFGPDFNPFFQTPTYPQQQCSSQFLNSGSGTSSALLGMGGGNSIGALNVKTISNDSLFLDNFTEEFDTLMNLRSPTLQVPQSAPPFSLSMGSGYACPGNYGLFSSYQPPNYNYNNYNNHYGRRSGRHHQKVPQPEYYSLKVFLGGIPANLTTNILQLNFAKFGKSFIDWPKKTVIQDRPSNGYAFVVFEKEQSVTQMLSQCKYSNDRIFYPIYTLNGLMHPVWQMANTIYNPQENWRKFRRFSVFVGGIPRVWTAQMLTMAVEEVIGKVVYCAIELDQDHFYPKGAACVVFEQKESYIKAIAAHKVMLNFVTSERQVEFKPFLASNMPCEKCGMTAGTRFCSEMICLAYFCQDCWKNVHSRQSMSTHKPSKRHVAEQPI